MITRSSSGTGINVDIAQPIDRVTLHDRFLRPLPRMEFSCITGAPADDPANASGHSGLLASSAATFLLNQYHGPRAAGADRTEVVLHLPGFRVLAFHPHSPGLRFHSLRQWFAIADRSNEQISRNEYRNSSAPDSPVGQSGPLGQK